MKRLGQLLLPLDGMLVARVSPGNLLGLPDGSLTPIDTRRLRETKWSSWHHTSREQYSNHQPSNHHRVSNRHRLSDCRRLFDQKSEAITTFRLHYQPLLSSENEPAFLPISSRGGKGTVRNHDGDGNEFATKRLVYICNTMALEVR